ncbi:hypothetical protein SAMN04488030_0408 [Aliiroseovarius halocynthiae]|nr:hypothetical protein SAMN04488030_0408 [Aliiroseovarius halocynthiae]
MWCVSDSQDWRGTRRSTPQVWGICPGGVSKKARNLSVVSRQSLPQGYGARVSLKDVTHDTGCAVRVFGRFNWVALRVQPDGHNPIAGTQDHDLKIPKQHHLHSRSDLGQDNRKA